MIYMQPPQPSTPKCLTLDLEEVGSNPGGVDILFSPHFDSLPIFTRSPQKVGPKGGTKKWDQSCFDL